MSETAREKIGDTKSPSNIRFTFANATNAKEEDFLNRVVRYDSRNGTKYLGLVEDVVIDLKEPYEENASKANLPHRRLKIRNLLSIKKTLKSTPTPLRNAPDVNQPVFFASQNDLKDFFEITEQGKHVGYLGNVEGSFLLPFDFDLLAFSNTAIIAGTGHGKSKLAGLITAQLYFMNKKVLILDGTGQWIKQIKEIEKKFRHKTNFKLKTDFYKPSFKKTERSFENHCTKIVSEIESKVDSVKVIDLSFGETGISPEERLKARCKFALTLERQLMEKAERSYINSGKKYNFQTVVILEEAHEFAASKGRCKTYSKTAF